MRKFTVISTLVQECSYLVDQNEACSVEEVKSHIENKDLIDWLEEKYPFNAEVSIDFSLWKPDHRRYVCEELLGFVEGYSGDEYRKWGIRNNGYNLLISWGTEILRDLYGRDNDSDWIE